jgi:hypothetical protein
MNALTENARAVLVSAARLRGEPQEMFTAKDLADFHNNHDLEAGNRPTVVERGLKTFTLPALIRRNYAFKFDTNGEPQYCLTNSGFEEALIITGGRGLL